MLGNTFVRVRLVFVSAWNLSLWNTRISWARLEFLITVLLNIPVLCHSTVYTDVSKVPQSFKTSVTVYNPTARDVVGTVFSVSPHIYVSKCCAVIENYTKWLCNGPPSSRIKSISGDTGPGKCQCKRFRCVLAFGTQVRGFEPGRSRRIFQGEKILSTPSFGGEVKPSVPYRRSATCKGFLQWLGSRHCRQNYRSFLAHSSPFRC
jgi:hypothetical protein